MSGTGPTTIEGLGPIPSYTGELPVWRRALNHTPDPRDGWFQILPSSKIIRTWVREAAAYHDVPHVFLAVMLQEENKPNASGMRLFGQYAERQLQAWGALLDEDWWPVPDAVAGGSTGIANMKRGTFRATDDYIAKTYKRSAAPEVLKKLPHPQSPHLYTKSDGIKLPMVDVRLFDFDLRIPGQDMRIDIYYMAARLRQLIDDVKGKGRPFAGDLTLDDIARIAAAYNGRGDAAAEYGRKNAERLKRAAAGQEMLHFYAAAGAEP